MCCSFSWNIFCSLFFLTFHDDCYISEDRLPLPGLSHCPYEADRPHQICLATESFVQVNICVFSVLYKIRISHTLLGSKHLHSSLKVGCWICVLILSILMGKLRVGAYLPLSHGESLWEMTTLLPTLPLSPGNTATKIALCSEPTSSLCGLGILEFPKLCGQEAS